jgi:predicted transglutaminase-like cysteine proteinase
LPNIAGAFLAATVLLVGLQRPTYADQFAEPFGISTMAVDQGPLVEIWNGLRERVFPTDLKAVARCGPDQTDECTAASRLLAVVTQAAQYEGKAFLGHLNRSINLSIRASTVPANWTGALNAIERARGDCKDYAIAKYFALLIAGMSPEQIRLVIVRNRPSHQTHLVVAVHYDDQWLILDNLHHLILRASEERDYEPLFVLDDGGVRRNVSVDEVSQPMPAANRALSAR